MLKVLLALYPPLQVMLKVLAAIHHSVEMQCAVYICVMCSVQHVHCAVYNVVVGWCEQHQAARESASGIGDKHSRVGFSTHLLLLILKPADNDDHHIHAENNGVRDSGCRSL